MSRPRKKGMKDQKGAKKRGGLGTGCLQIGLRQGGGKVREVHARNEVK